jgi:hypothetical protein
MKNLYDFIKTGKVELGDNGLNRKHCELIPTPFKGLIVGVTNSGKTNLLLRLMLGDGILDYNTIHLISNSCDQAKYANLKMLFDHGCSKEAARRTYENGKLILSFYSNGLRGFLRTPNLESRDPVITFNCYLPSGIIPLPNELDPSLKHLVIFDDLMENKNQTIPESYFCRGRHNSADCFYIAQNYFKINRQCIRTNANFIILFKQAKRDLQVFYRDYVEIDFPDFANFEQFCNDAWEKKYGYVVIDIFNENKNKRYRKGWDDFHILT